MCLANTHDACIFAVMSLQLSSSHQDFQQSKYFIDYLLNLAIVADHFFEKSNHILVRNLIIVFAPLFSFHWSKERHSGLKIM